jgi:predicted DNA-binding ribbon-helix-helix protein
MRLEPELWDALREICAREHQGINGLVRHIESVGHSGGRTSAVRVFVVEYFRNAATEVGNKPASDAPSHPVEIVPQAA